MALYRTSGSLYSLSPTSFHALDRLNLGAGAQPLSPHFSHTIAKTTNALDK